MTRRAGFGVALPLSVGLMVLLGLAGLVLLFRSGSNLGVAARDAGGAAAESLALSAIEEVLYQFQTRVNDPADPVFRAVRAALLAGDEPELDLGDLCPSEHLAEVMAASPHAPFYRRLTLEDTTLTLRVPMREAALEALGEEDAARAVLPGEQFLDATATVRLDLADWSLWRKVAVRRRYGMTFVSPYKPFDRVTVAILSSGFLEAYPRVIQETRSLLVRLSQAARFLASMRAQLGTTGSAGTIRATPALVPLGVAPPLTYAARRDLDDLLDDLGPDSPVVQQLDAMDHEERSWAEWGLVQTRARTSFSRAPPIGGRTWDLRLPGVRPGSLDLQLPPRGSILFSTAPEVDLAEMDLDRRLAEVTEDPLERLTRAAEVYNRAAAGLLGGGGYALDEDELEALERAADALARVIRSQVPAMVAGMNAITADANRFTTVGMTTGVYEGYLAAGSRRLRSLAWHLEHPRDLEVLRERLPVFNGHLNYNGREPLTLDLEDWRGVTVMSAPWREEVPRVTLRGLTLADPTRDLVSLNFPEVHLGGDPVHASLFVHDRAVFYAPARIRGNLVLRRLARRGERTRQEDLRGTVRYDPRIASGGLWSRRPDDGGVLPPDLSLRHYTVGLCPRYQRKAIFRSPAQAEAAWTTGGEA